MKNDELCAGSRAEVLGRRRVYDGFFKLDLVQHRYRRHDGVWSASLERIVFERGDAATVLPYDLTRRRVVLVCQFRLPAHLREGQGWLWETIAGIIDLDREPVEVARAEAWEEAGLRLEALEHVTTFYASCGGSTEQVHVYIAPYEATSFVAAGGGLTAEGEDIAVREFDIDEALSMVADGAICDAKTIIALQHLALRRAL